MSAAKSRCVVLASVVLIACSINCTSTDPSHGAGPDSGGVDNAPSNADAGKADPGNQDASAEAGSAGDSETSSGDAGGAQEASTPEDSSSDTGGATAKCRRDGGAKAGECCVTQDDCERPPFSSGLCCRKHVCFSCSDMR